MLKRIIVIATIFIICLTATHTRVGSISRNIEIGIVQLQEKLSNEIVSPKETTPDIKEQKAVNDLSRSNGFEHRFKKIHEKTKKIQFVRVIVKLGIETALEGELKIGERRMQRQLIRQKQDKFLESFSGYQSISLKRFTHVPYLAFSIGKIGLEHLHSSTEIVDIFEDTLVPSATTESLTIVGAQNAWARGYTGAGKTIAVLDTGVDKTHPYLSGKVVSEACYSTYDPDNNISPVCPGQITQTTDVGSGVNCNILGQCEHGTRIAGVAAGSSGVAKGASIISIQIYSRVDDSGICNSFGKPSPCVLSSISDQMSALDRVIALKDTYSIAAVNLSLATGNYLNTCDTASPLTTYIEQLRSFGIATVVASGNDSDTNSISSPACISYAISVGATGDGSGTPLDTIWPQSNSASFLSLLAPGSVITAPIPGSGTDSTSGTSLATAHVSGAWAILKQQKPNATVPEVLNKLRYSGVNITDSRNSIITPRINIDSALSCLQNIPATKWKGEYYDNPNLTGDPVMIRDDGEGFLEKNFGDGSPESKCSPGTDNFSVRWTRTIYFQEGLYRFHINTDDGVRLYVDGVNKMDYWSGGAGVHFVDVPLTANNHVIKLELKENSGLAYAYLSWSTPCVTLGISSTRWKGEYFNNPDLSGTPIMVRDDGDGFINSDWGTGGPSSECFVNTDNFSVRWTRTINFPGSGFYRFTIIGDDGVRLYVDDMVNPKFDLWGTTAGNNVLDVDISSGTHVVKYEYREFGGLAYAKLFWSPAAPSNFTANVASAVQINLNWSDNSYNEDGFKIERWNGNSYAEIATVGANITTYSDTSLSPGTTYSYRIKSFNNGGHSRYSSESSATTLACNYSVNGNGALYRDCPSCIQYTVNVNPGCSWTAYVNPGSEYWISIVSGSSGIGYGIVWVSVSAGTGVGSGRTGYLTVAGTTQVINQSGCPYPFNCPYHGPPGGCNYQCPR